MDFSDWSRHPGYPIHPFVSDQCSKHGKSSTVGLDLKFTHFLKLITMKSAISVEGAGHLPSFSHFCGNTSATSRQWVGLFQSRLFEVVWVHFGRCSRRVVDWKPKASISDRAKTFGSSVVVKPSQLISHTHACNRPNLAFDILTHFETVQLILTFHALFDFAYWKLKYKL